MALRKDGRVIAVGIDLGTTTSCVGVWRNSRVEIVPNYHGNRTTPSCVAFIGKEEVLVGEEAEEQRNLNLEATVSCVKLLIGRKCGDLSIYDSVRYFHYNNVRPRAEVAYPGIPRSPRFVVRRGDKEEEYCAEQIAGAILTTLQQLAASYLGTEVKRAVVAVPANFDDLRRSTTKAAGVMAGFREIGIVSAPVAAAIAYGFHRTGNTPRIKNVLVFDLGGTSLEISLLHMEGSKTEVTASAGDARFGGDDFDDSMVNHFAAEFQGRHRSAAIWANSRALSRLKSASERAKRRLSFASKAAVAIEYLHQGIDFQSSITRKKFEEINEKNFSRCVAVLDHFFAEATSIGKENVQEVVLVGGSTRIPRIQNLLRNYFPGKELCMSINPEEVVAYGATVVAARMVGRRRGEVAPLSLGVSGPGGIMEVVIQRNTPIPTQKSKELYLPCDSQDWLVCGVFEGERSMAADNHYLGGVLLKGLPSQQAYLPKITVTFEVDAEGVLRVTGEMQELKMCVPISADGWGTGRRSLEDIAGMVAAAEAQKEDDKRRKRKAKLQAELKALLCNLRLLVTKQARESKLDAGDKESMEAEIAETTNWMQLNEGAEAVDFETKIKHLANRWCKVCKFNQPFISLQMLQPSYQHI